MWNLFFGDAQGAIEAAHFVAKVYADDLNAFRVYGRQVEDHVILADIDSLQAGLHRWGRANQVVFDAAKESKHIICTQRPYGKSFKILGVTFGTKLAMKIVIDDVTTQSGKWSCCTAYADCITSVTW